MDQNISRTYLLLVRTAWEYLGSGALRGLMKLRIGPILAALYPVAMILLQLLVVFLLGLSAFYLGNLCVHWVTGTAAGLAVFCAILWWFERKDVQLFAYYLMHDYGYSAKYQGQNPPELETRMALFTDRIAEALQSDVDEVLIVDYSSGAHLAVSILADLICQGRVSEGGPHLSLLTLGHVIPMISFLRKSDRLRADINFLCQTDVLAWVDVSAPGDGATFAPCDPIAVSGVAPESGHHLPLVLSAAFTQTLSEAKLKELGRRFFRLHFQYLCAFDLLVIMTISKSPPTPKPLGIVSPIAPIHHHASHAP